MYANPNVNQIIYGPAGVCFVYMYNTSTFFTFQIFASTTPSSIFKLGKISGPIFSYSKRSRDEFILYIFFLSGFSFTDTDNSQDSRGREGTIFYSTLPLPPAYER